eukprot:scaffold3264_cov20-Prasinocladus_malaysianus.AAC.1
MSIAQQVTMALVIVIAPYETRSQRVLTTVTRSSRRPPHLSKAGERANISDGRLQKLPNN